MSKRIYLPLACALLAGIMVLAGCANKQTTGAAIGAGAGAVLGHQFGGGRGQTLMTIVGAIGGAVAGGAIGKHMEEQDRQKAAYALENNRTGQTSTWTNPDTGYKYAVTPTKTQNENGRPCRTFVFKSYDANGQAQSTTRLACRQSDGTWKIQQ
ncbi:MAG: RT0821/Lpp0805 family surface protein [Gammaproteobacteria bacterium]